MASVFNEGMSKKRKESNKIILTVTAMNPEGPEFFDNDEVFEIYTQGRNRQDSPNDTLEKPVLWELIAPVSGQKILDLGCGDASIGKELLENGALAYLGIEGSQNMFALAQSTLNGTAGEVIHADLRSWDYPSNVFDLVISRLALHYIQDLGAVFSDVFNSLIRGGKFVFSVEHPVITSCDRAYPPGTKRQDWIVDNYFETGIRITNWMGGQVVKYHHTIEDYFIRLQEAGFVVEQLRESRPQRSQFNDEAAYERRKRIPLFLFLSARKP